jgi:protein-tyrosine phosphatase
MAEPASTAPATTFRVLCVCTANRYRSALAEHLLRRVAHEYGLDWTVASAGTAAVAGEPPDPRTVEVLGRYDVHPSSWRTTRLDAALVDRADLVLVAAEEHRRRVVALQPAALHRTFPLLQFARLADAAAHATRPVAADEPSGSAGELLIERVRRARAVVQPVPPGADDLTDPVGRPKRILRRCAAEIDAAVRVIGAAARSDLRD